MDLRSQPKFWYKTDISFMRLKKEVTNFYNNWRRLLQLINLYDIFVSYVFYTIIIIAIYFFNLFTFIN